MKKKSVVGMILFAFCAATLMHAQADLARQSVPALQIEGWGLEDVMHQVASKTQLTIGLELDLVMGTEGHVKLDFPGGTVTELADKCAALMPGVSWKIVYNRSLLLYLRGKATALSEQKIEFDGVTNATHEQVWRLLMQNTKFNEWLEAQACKSWFDLGGGRSQQDRAVISIPSGQISIGDLLESAAVQSSKHFWSLLGNTRNGQCEVWIALW